MEECSCLEYFRSSVAHFEFHQFGCLERVHQRSFLAEAISSDLKLILHVLTESS